MSNGFAGKIVACFTLAALLVFSGLGSALASAQYTSTQSFVDYLESEKIIYNYKGILSLTEEEQVTVTYTLDNLSPQTCSLYFHPDGDSVSLRIWSIVTVTAGENYIFSTLQTLNQKYKYAKFVYDESDSTVEADMDMYIDPYRCGEVVCDNMQVLFTIVDDAASMLQSLE